MRSPGSEWMLHYIRAMLKNIIPSLLFIAVCSLGQAQAPEWQWARSAGGGYMDRGNDICTDASGNIYVTGFFSSGGISFSDDISFNNTQSNNSADGFLVKYDAAGTVLWAKHFEGIGSQNGKALAIAGDGVVVAIECSGTTTIDGETFTMNETAILLVRFEADGSLTWGNSPASGAQVSVATVATSADGSIAICGSYNDAPLTTSAGALENNGNYDLYVMKLNVDGDATWARRAGGSLDDDVASVAIDGDGNIVVAGYYTSAGMNIAGTDLTNANDNYTDMFLAKYAADGSGTWAIGYGGLRHERAWDVAVDMDDNIIICGGFIDATFDLAGTTLNNTTTDNSWYDLFVAKFSAAGSLDWAVADGGTYDEFVRSVTVSADGSIHVGGYFDSNDAQFGSDVLEAAGSGYDAFIAKYSADGTAIWGKGVGSSSGDHGESIAVDAGGGIVLTGYFGAEFEIAGEMLEHASDNDVWVLKLGGTTDVQENFSDLQITAHPNPTNDRIVIFGEFMDEILVRDVQGREIMNVRPNSDRAAISLDHAGIYIVQIRIGDRWAQRRIVRY